MNQGPHFFETIFFEAEQLLVQNKLVQSFAPELLVNIRVEREGMPLLQFNHAIELSKENLSDTCPAPADDLILIFHDRKIVPTRQSLPCFLECEWRRKVHPGNSLFKFVFHDGVKHMYLPGDKSSPVYFIACHLLSRGKPFEIICNGNH